MYLLLLKYKLDNYISFHNINFYLEMKKEN